LRFFGAAVECLLTVPPKLARHMEKMGLTVPAPRVLVAQIDSGASTTVVRTEILEATGIPPTGARRVDTVDARQVEWDFYPVLLVIPDGTPFETVAAAADIGLREIDCLLGRDLLNLGTFVYNGIAGTFEFTMGG
jgi:predicted aspartyl protease